MRMWVLKQDNRVITFDEPENAAQDYFFCLSSDYYIHLLTEVMKIHKKQGDARESRCIKAIIDGLKQMGSA